MILLMANFIVRMDTHFNQIHRNKLHHDYFSHNNLRQLHQIHCNELRHGGIPP